jgi:hypothetical protein
VKHYQPQPVHIVQPPPAVTKRALLLDRKRGLELQVAAAHRKAREECQTPNVTAMSACLRAVKKQLAALPTTTSRP